MATTDQAVSAMALLKHEHPESECVGNDTTSEVLLHPLLRLTGELRQMIFMWSIEMSRSPTPKLVHETNLRLTWKDRPSPLLSTSRQFRDEVKDLLRHHKHFPIRVTTFGAAFDMLSLSCFIAQDLPKTYFGLPELQVEIWPPHQHRSRDELEMVYLYKHLQKLRIDLCAGTQIPHLSIFFQENELVNWADKWRPCQEGLPRLSLVLYDWTARNDMELVLDQFAFVTNVDKAGVRLLPSLQHNEQLEEHASMVVERMENGFLPHDYDIYSDVTDARLD